MSPPFNMCTPIANPPPPTNNPPGPLTNLHLNFGFIENSMHLVKCVYKSIHVLLYLVLFLFFLASLFFCFFFLTCMGVFYFVKAMGLS